MAQQCPEKLVKKLLLMLYDGWERDPEVRVCRGTAQNGTAKAVKSHVWKPCLFGSIVNNILGMPTLWKREGME